MSPPASPASRRRHAPLAGILWMLAANACFAAMVSLFKLAVLEGAPLPMALACRALLAFIAMTPLLARRGLGSMRPQRPLFMLMRCASGAVAFGCTQWAVQLIGAANATAISYSRPLWMIPIAALALGERIGLGRAAAAAIGFAGVLVLVRPGGEMHWGALLALVGGLGGAGVVLSLRLLSATEPALRIVFWYAAWGCLLWGPWALLVGRLPSALGLAAMGCGAFCGLVGDVMASHAVGLAEATVIAPVEYAQIAFVAIYAFLLFGEAPPWTTWLGVALMLAATVLIAQRARRERARA